MLNMKKILLPIDFERPNLSVVQQAAVLAHKFHSQIFLLHVVTPLSYSAGILEGTYVPAGREDLLAELIRQAQRHLDQCLKPELEGLSVERILRQGDPALEIVKAARDTSADLLMMPTHGYGRFRRFLLGSVTAKVLHDSEYPVWTGAHIEEEPVKSFTIDNIVCAIDLSEHSLKTVSVAAQLAAEFKAKLTVAHITAKLEASGGDNANAADNAAAMANWQKTMVSSAVQQINCTQEKMGIKAAVFVDQGDVAKVLSNVVVQKRADLLVIGRNPAAGHLRSTGYGIIRESRAPVLSV
jgi:nucleotide-binding universal stress UspA family protein